MTKLSILSMIACHAANILFFWSWSAKAKRKQRIIGLVAQAVAMVYFIDTGLLEPGIWNLAFMIANTYRLVRDWNTPTQPEIQHMTDTPSEISAEIKIERPIRPEDYQSPRVNVPVAIVASLAFVAACTSIAWLFF
jgi:hypothetical protein